MRMVFPLIRSGGKAVGRELLNTTANILSDVGGDDDVSFKTTLKSRGQEGFNNLKRKAVNKMSGGGGGVGGSGAAYKGESPKKKKKKPKSAKTSTTSTSSHQSKPKSTKKKTSKSSASVNKKKTKKSASLEPNKTFNYL